MTEGGAPGWEGGVAGRLANLAGARMVAQALGLGWFLFAARRLDPRDFGLMSAGLALVIVIGGLSDLGTTRTVVRHIAADPGSLRATFVRAASVRAAAGAVGGAVAVAVLRLVAPDIPSGLLVLAGAIAVASGVTEVGFSSLRATGRVGTEVTLLVVERLAFVLLAGLLVWHGHGPGGVLLAYAATNALSATVVSIRVHQLGRGGRSPAGPLFDKEGRSTAWSSSLVIVGPRISVLILVVVATPTVLGAFSIAQETPDALGTLGTAALLPVLALLRSARAGDRWPAALDRGSRITAAVAGALAPVVAWLVIDGRRSLSLLFDAGHRKGATPALAFLAAAALLWVIRTLGEMVLLAQERAATYLRALGLGLAVNLVLGVPFVHAWGAAGAAAATLAGELTVLSVVLVAVRDAGRALVRPLAVVAVAAAAGALATVATRGLPLAVAVVAVGLVALASLGFNARSLVGLRGGAAAGGATRGSGLAGDHADVGAQVGGYLAGDGVEAVEHGAGPSKHL